jgi:hypothetical protein
LPVEVKVDFSVVFGRPAHVLSATLSIWEDGRIAR